MGKHFRVALTVVAVLVVGLAVPGGTAPDDPAVTFTASGDFAASANTDAVLTTVAALDRDAHFALGDLSYGVTGQEQAWCDFVTQRVGAGFPFELLAGNHESDGINGNINDFSACLPNQLPGLVGTYGRQYYVDVPAEAPLVRFVMISPGLTFPDGAWSYDAGSPRYQWTSQAIDGARTAGVPWVVVGMHKPCISVGRYGCDPGVDIMDLLLDKRVDLVLSGHDHIYQRSKQLGLGPGCESLTVGTYDADCVTDHDSDLVKGAGTVLSTIGTSGIALRDVLLADPEGPYFLASAGANQNPTFGTLDVRATADRLDASFVRASGGDFTDSFTITRPDPTTTTTSASTTSSTSSSTTSSSTTSSSTTSSTTTTTTAPVPDLIRDDFERTVGTGWGSAPIGGPWSVSTAADFSVHTGRGRLRVPTAGSARNALLSQVSSDQTDLRTVLSTDKLPGGSGLYTTIYGRNIPGVGYYGTKIRFRSDGLVQLSLTRVTASNEQVPLSSIVTIPDYTHAPGGNVEVRLEVTGTSPTQVRVKAWPQGTVEPAPWTASASDATGGFQTPGSVGFYAYLSSGAANAPVTLSVDDLAVPAD